VAIAKWYIFINGHGQGARVHTGLGYAYRQTRDMHCEDSAVIELHDWRTNVKTLATRIAAQSVESPLISLSGFSYGGMTAVSLCRILERYNLDVTKLFLVDAVWRKRDKIASPWSLLDRWRIHTPANVRSCLSWRQHVGVLKGHQVIPAKSTLFEERTCNVRHVLMDSQRDVIDEILDFNHYISET
jgi:hypothetical protein